MPLWIKRVQANRRSDIAYARAHEEMEEILEMINSSANTGFEYLVDAVEFLLEVA